MPRWAYDLENRLNTLAKTTGARIVSELDDRITSLETNVNQVGAAIQDEIQQVKDAIAAGTVSEADLARLDALSGQLTGSLSDLQADDAPPPTP